MDGSGYSQYPVSKDAGEVRLQAGRSDSSGKNGEYLVRLFHIWEACNGLTKERRKDLAKAVSLELISTKEALPFYRRMGFEERPCEWDGPGMMKMLR